MSLSRATFVFCGPSISHADAARIVPVASVRPPIRRFDLDEVGAGALVAIIDGVFDAQLAVSTREIRDALGRGVRVLGASSMGALRAVEVPEMLGVGRIYEMYRCGDIMRDDEVAVLFNPETGRALTEPLVNVRFAVERLVCAGTITEELGVSIVTAATQLHFHDRTYRNILRVAGLGARADAKALLSALKSFDLKYEDARTLLEALDTLSELPHWNMIAARPPESPEVDHVDLPDALSPVDTPLNSPIVIWESGDSVSFDRLLDFLVATGKFDAVGRRAIGRFLLGGGEIADVDVSHGQDAVLSVQNSFREIATCWGWRSHEEIHTTLRDLGLRGSGISDQLRYERTARLKLIALYRSRPPEFLDAVRFELFSDDLSLKREAMRLGALEALARMSVGGDIQDAELMDARSAALCGRPELEWGGLLAEAGDSEKNVSSTIQLLARARRFGVPLLAKMDSAPSMPNVVPRGLSEIPPSTFSPGTKRTLCTEDAAANSRAIASRIGVTRIAQIGELARFGLHVTSAYRPSSWSSTVGSGKSVSLDEAITGSVMEEAEKYCQERFVDADAVRSSFADLREPAIDPHLLDLPYDTRYTPATVLDWTRVHDLISGESVFIAATALSSARQTNDPLYSPRRGARLFSTSGLASGFSLADAILHALCEVVERHALKLSEQAVGNPGALPEARWPHLRFVDLETCPGSTRHLVAAIRGAGYEPRVLDVTSEVSVPTFEARIMIPRFQHGVEDSWPGYGTHPDPEVAINRALLECVQSRVTFLSGAREDFALRARSLGRHERPRPESNGEAYWFRPHVPKKEFQALSGFLASNARDALSFVCGRVAAAGFPNVVYKEMTRDEVAPARVVRVVVPGMESPNPFHTGLRARVLMVADLMHKHGW